MSNLRKELSTCRWKCMCQKKELKDVHRRLSETEAERDDYRDKLLDLQGRLENEILYTKEEVEGFLAKGTDGIN